MAIIHAAMEILVLICISSKRYDSSIHDRPGNLNSFWSKKTCKMKLKSILPTTICLA